MMCTNKAHYPPHLDGPELVLLYTQITRADDHGRSSFDVEWMQGDRRCGQCFRADMTACMQRDVEQRGYEVRVRIERVKR